MTLSIDQLRREVGEHRDKKVRLHRSEDALKHRVEEAEAQLARFKQELEHTQGQIAFEQRAIEALEAAVAVLTERMPVPTPQPEPERVRDPQLPLLGDPRTIATRKTEQPGERAAMTYARQRAEELDLTEVPARVFERADYIAMILVENGPMRQHEIARVLAELLDAPERVRSVAHAVSECMPVLLRQGRVQPVDEAERYVTWEATPAERASARLGVDVDNYAGTTTRWPTESQMPPAGSRIQVESSAFESGKDR